MKSVFGGPVRGHVQAELLSAYLDQQASPAERVHIDAHLQQCAECRAELDSLRRTVTLLQALPRVPVPRAFTLSEAQVGIRRPSGSPGWLGGLVRGLGAVAAMALVAFVALSVLRPENAPWNPSAQTMARARPTDAPAATAAPAAPVANPAALAQSQPEAASVFSAEAQPTPAVEPQTATEPPALLAAAPPLPTTAAADAATARTAPTAEPLPAATGSAPLMAKAAPAPTEGSGVSAAGVGAAAAAPGAGGVAATGRGAGGGPGEPYGVPSEFLTPEPTPPGEALDNALPSDVRIVYADLNALWAIDRDGGVRQLVQGQGINSPQLSPDQEWIVYRIYTSAGAQLWAIRWEGGEPKLLLDDATLPNDNLPAGYTRRLISDSRWVSGSGLLAVTLSLIPNAANPTTPLTELWQLNVATGEFRRSGELGSAGRPYYAPDGKSYIVLQYGSDEKPEGSLSLVDAASGKGKPVLTFPAGPGKNSYEGQIAWAADSKAALIAIPTADYGAPQPPNGTKLYRLSTNGRVEELGEIDAAQVSWSSDMTALAYTRYTDASLATNELYIADANGANPKLYASMTQGEFIGWSPAGIHFLYQDNFQIFVGAAGLPPRKLANSTSMVNPRWISENAILAYHDLGENGWLLTLRDVDGQAVGLLPLPRESMLDVRSR